jgi:hypothetical protein
MANEEVPAQEKITLQPEDKARLSVILTSVTHALRAANTLKELSIQFMESVKAGTPMDPAALEKITQAQLAFNDANVQARAFGHMIKDTRKMWQKRRAADMDPNTAFDERDPHENIKRILGQKSWQTEI